MSNMFKNKVMKLVSEDLKSDLLGLDDDSSDEMFDDVPENPGLAQQKQKYTKTLQTLRSWIDRTEGWIEDLNGLTPGSMNSILNSVDCDSILADVQRSESKKISRLAQDMSSLSEALKQYLLQAQHKASKGEVD